MRTRLEKFKLALDLVGDPRMISHSDTCAFNQSQWPDTVSDVKAKECTCGLTQLLEEARA